MSDTTKLAIAGFGLVGQRHAQSIAQCAGVELCAIIEPGDADAPPGVAHLASLEDCLSLPAARRPHGIILATPTPLHHEQALACIAAGIPVLIEKPIAVRATEGAEIAAAAEAAGVPVLVGHHRRHNPLIARAKQVIADGDLGTLRAAHVTCWFYKPDHYFEQAPWRKQPGAGPVSVNLVHDVDLLRHLVGEVETVQAQAAPALRGYENEDVAAALLRFTNGAIGTLTVSDAIASPWSWELTARENPAYPPTDQSALTIGGSRASLSIPDLRLWHHGETPDWWSPISATTLPRAEADPLVEQIRHFADVLAGRADPLVSAREGTKSLTVVEAVQRSAATGETVRLP